MECKAHCVVCQEKNGICINGTKVECKELILGDDGKVTGVLMEPKWNVKNGHCIKIRIAKCINGTKVECKVIH